jgi:hypothetical protein
MYAAPLMPSWRLTGSQDYQVVTGIVEDTSREGRALSQLHLLPQNLPKPNDVQGCLAAPRCLNREGASGFHLFWHIHARALRVSERHCRESQAANQKRKPESH